MNNRIKDLMLEAGFATPELALRTRKFAELLVKECQSRMLHVCCELELNANPFIDDLTNHFGIQNDLQK